MPTSPLNGVIQNFLADLGPDGDGMTDGELLARFLRSRDEEALATLVRRHAQMVWGVCRRLLHHHDAEDAFQATFLVLVRKAADVPKRAVANWLYGVARQTAVRLRATTVKRGQRETQVVTMPEPTMPEVHADLPSAVDEELSYLPDHYRSVIVLCDLEDLTRKEAARQLGIPEGSVASRLARARALLAKRLNQRGIVFSGGSVAAVIVDGGASAAPPVLVASTIKTASLLAQGQAADFSARVVALTEGVVKAMFLTKIKAALVVVLILGFVATGTTIFASRMAAGQDDNKPAAEKPVPAVKEKDKDKEAVTIWGKEVDGLQAGLGFRPGEHRVYHHGETATVVLRVRNVGKVTVGFKHIHTFFLENPPTITDADGKTVELVKFTAQGVQAPLRTKVGPGVEVELYEWEFDLQPKGGRGKGLFTIHGTGKFSLQCERVVGPTLGNANHPNPTLDKLATGKLELEVKDANRVADTQAPAKAKEEPEARANPPAQPKQPPAKTDNERIVGGWAIVNEDSKRKGELWDIGTHEIVMNPNLFGLIIHQYFHRLDATKTPKQIDITVTAAGGLIGPNVPMDPNARVLGVIKGIYALDAGELRLCLGEMGKDRPAAFPAKPKPGEVLILHGGPEYKAIDRKLLTKEEKLQVLIDKVLAAHGGEGKLNRLQFTMMVKRSNGETQQIFVEPPKKNFQNFRSETTHRDRTGKLIVILSPFGQMWWTKEPNDDAKMLLGTVPPLEHMLDYAKFFGPRQVLRLKDADHKVTLLDEEIKIGDHAAVGVEVTGPQFKGKMYFDKEMHLLVRSGYTDYSDYKKFDDIPIARKEKHSRAGTGAWEAEVTEFRVVDKFDAKLFDQP